VISKEMETFIASIYFHSKSTIYDLSLKIYVGFIVNFSGTMYWYLRIVQWYGKKWKNFILHILSY